LEDFYTTERLANEFPALFSISMLKKSRMRDADFVGPPFFQIGRKVIYSRSAVLEWIAQQQRSVNKPTPLAAFASVARGRPTKAQEIARRQRAA